MLKISVSVVSQKATSFEEENIAHDQQHCNDSYSPVKKFSADQKHEQQDNDRKRQVERAALGDTPTEDLEEPGLDDVVNRSQRVPVVLDVAADEPPKRKRKLSAIQHLVRRLHHVRLVNLRHRNFAEPLGRYECEPGHDQHEDEPIDILFKSLQQSLFFFPNC